jgi:hypothetical protein
LDSGLREAAIEAHNEFIDLYHRLAHDADRPMWLDARTLRAVLDDMLDFRVAGQVGSLS